MANLSTPKMFTFLSKDFEDGWDALARDPKAKGRGNFTFALQSMILLEWACRLCATDPSGKWITAIAAKLRMIEPRYFTVLPGTCPLPKKFALPTAGGKPGTELLAVMFDLIRHGQAHQYQQIVANLTDGADFLFILTGAVMGRTLKSVRAAGRAPDHLGFRQSKGRIGVKVRTDWLYLDLKDAIRSSGLVSSGLIYPHFYRPDAKKVDFQYDSQLLKGALLAAGHSKV